MWLCGRSVTGIGRLPFFVIPWEKQFHDGNLAARGLVNPKRHVRGGSPPPPEDRVDVNLVGSNALGNFGLL